MSDEWPCYCAHMEGECEPCIMEREARAFWRGVCAERAARYASRPIAKGWAYQAIRLRKWLAGAEGQYP